MAKIHDILAAVRTFFSVARDPANSERVHRFEKALMRLSTPRDLQRVAAAYRSSPAMAEALDRRDEPPAHSLSSLGGCAPGTLGHAYYRFMTDNGFSPDFYPMEGGDDDLAYLRRRALQVHDIWHLILSYPPDFLGELKIAAFSLAHIASSVRRDRLLASSFVLLVVLGFMAHVLLFRPRLLRAALGGFRDGLRRGRTARRLWAVRWEDLWDQPLRALQATYVP